MSSIYDRPETVAQVQTPEYAVAMFAWAGDTLTDLPSYFDLSDDEFDAFAARTEQHSPGSTRTDGPAHRPTCDSCGVDLVARRGHTPEQAWCGMWWDHPGASSGTAGIGHTSSAVYPAPHERAARAAQGAAKSGHATPPPPGDDQDDDLFESAADLAGRP